jgi:hypothetical protein
MNGKQSGDSHARRVSGILASVLTCSWIVAACSSDEPAGNTTQASGGAPTGGASGSGGKATGGSGGNGSGGKASGGSGGALTDARPDRTDTNTKRPGFVNCEPMRSLSTATECDLGQDDYCCLYYPNIPLSGQPVRECASVAQRGNAACTIAAYCDEDADCSSGETCETASSFGTVTHCQGPIPDAAIPDADAAVSDATADRPPADAQRE